MVLIALLAAAAASAPANAEPTVSAQRPIVRQATATVRIVSGARVEASSIPGEALIRNVRTEAADGSRQDSRLVEFP